MIWREHVFNFGQKSASMAEWFTVFNFGTLKMVLSCDPPILAQLDVQYCRVDNDVLNHLSESLTSDILPGPSDVVENLK